MEYKTPIIAKRLGVSPKAVVRIAQQLNLSIKKNKYGHFIFTQNDLDKMLEYHRSQIEPTSSPTIEPSIDFEKFVTQLNTITHRLNRIEEKMQDKADDVVNYQLLQHRRELEEMMDKIQKLEAALEKKEQIYITPDITPTYEREEKPKRRKMIFSIFGF
ncbi:chromosome segregation protein [Bacillus sp. C1]